jgi:hypothetical protein
VNEEQHSFLHRIFFGNQDGTEREQRVFEYICHRVGDGAHLRDVLGEEYVRRNASPDEIEQILEDPRLIETATRRCVKTFPPAG